jgi:DNA-binding CsgD family transcriptional regulator
MRPIKLDGLASLGRWEEAETLIEEAARDADIETSRQAARYFVGTLLRQGRVAEAAAAVRRTDHGYQTPHMGTFVLAARIRLAWAEGRWDDARAAVDEAIGLFEDPAREINVIGILELSVALEADRAEIARGRRRTAEATASRQVGVAHLAVVRRSAMDAIGRGGAGRLIAAELAMAEAEGSRLEDASDATLWQEAARRCSAISQPWEEAYARYRQAEAMLATAGHRQVALPLLTEAHRIATGLGARPLVDQIEALARRGRLRLATAPAEHAHRRATTLDGVVVQLTAREREVLSMVAAGHTNREIGDELFISNKTASVHISNAMDKLGALSRYEAAAIATRIGLLDS